MAFSNYLRAVAARASAFVLLVSLLLPCLFSCQESDSFTLDDIPEYSGEAYVEINGNQPFFESEEITTESYTNFSELDELARAGSAMGCLSRSLMPSDEREPLFSENPTGFYSNGKSNNNKYKFIDGGYIYNRCHLIGFQLTGENSNKKNLITGTQYMNIHGMLPFENRVAAYLRTSGNHVMYRVTPMYREYDMVARGVLMEAYSVEDKGSSICFCVFVYNVQQGVVIDYYSGENNIDTTFASKEDFEPATTYVLNTNSKKYHLPSCYHIKNTKPECLKHYSGDPSEFASNYPAFSPCLTCNPNKGN